MTQSIPSALLPAPDTAGAQRPPMRAPAVDYSSTWVRLFDMRAGKVFAEARHGDWQHISERAAEYYECEAESVDLLDTEEFDGEYADFLTVDGEPVARLL